MVYSNLGEGANDHIGIFLYLYDHKSMSLMPLIRPLHSSPLVIPDVTTQFIINAIKTQHKYLIRSFKEVLYVDDALREKIITSVNTKWVAVFRDYNNKSIKNTINVILKNLFDIYSKITPQMLTQSEDFVKQITLDVNT